jgi:hypothetical protein
MPLNTKNICREHGQQCVLLIFISFLFKKKSAKSDYHNKCRVKTWLLYFYLLLFKNPHL